MKQTRHSLTIGAAIVLALLPVMAAAQNPPPLPPLPPPQQQQGVNGLPPNPGNSGNNQEPRRPPRDPSIASLMAYILDKGLAPVIMIDDPVIAFGNEDLWVAEPEASAATVRVTTATRATSRQPRTAVTR